MDNVVSQSRFMESVQEVSLSQRKSSFSSCGEKFNFESEVKSSMVHCGKKVIVENEVLSKVSHSGKKIIVENEDLSKVSHSGRKVIVENEELSEVSHSDKKIIVENEELSKVSHCGEEINVKNCNLLLVELFEKVHESGLPNYKGCRIPLPFSKFNMPLWRRLLADYDDKIICDLLEFGFPLDFDRNVTLCTNERRNHKGARDYPVFVNKYLQSETTLSRIAGPFRSNPLSVPLMVSPLNTVPKDSDDERRVIVDLSWPLGEGSVNSGISKEMYLEEKIESNYASVEDVCKMVLDSGPGSLIYKRDLRKAYRQFPVDPADYYLLGYCWDDQYFIDTVLAMGQRNAGVGCSRVSNAVMYMHSLSGYQGVSYLDDLIGVADPSTASDAYNQLGTLLRELGLEENIPKACPPSTIQNVLGVIIDTEQMTISVTDERMTEIAELLAKWRRKKVCRKKELQSLIGKLCFICKCIRQSRVFLNRLLAVLRSVDWTTTDRVTLSEDFHKELRWWSTFMASFNGVGFIPSPIWSEPDVAMATDSCLSGCGGICANEYFHTQFPSKILNQGFPIHKLEFLAVLVGARTWGHLFGGQKMVMYCDNMAVVEVINSSKTRDAFMATCLRELWLVVAKNKFELRAIHLPGEENRVADWLSRWHLDSKYQDLFKNFSTNSSCNEVLISDDLFEFSGDI